MKRWLVPYQKSKLYFRERSHTSDREQRYRIIVLLRIDDRSTENRVSADKFDNESLLLNVPFLFSFSYQEREIYII